MKGLTRDEMETVVVAMVDGLVVIDSTVRPDIRRMRRDSAFEEVETGFWGDTEHSRFTIPRERWNPVGGVKRTRNMSDSQKQASAERLRVARRGLASAEPLMVPTFSSENAA